MSHVFWGESPLRAEVKLELLFVPSMVTMAPRLDLKVAGIGESMPDGMVNFRRCGGYFRSGGFLLTEPRKMPVGVFRFRI
jgi:hypothetical protein